MIIYLINLSQSYMDNDQIMRYADSAQINVYEVASLAIHRHSLSFVIRCFVLHQIYMIVEYTRYYQDTDIYTRRYTDS